MVHSQLDARTDECNTTALPPGWIAIYVEWYHTASFGTTAGIYCASTNWIYNGLEEPMVHYRFNGEAADLCGSPWQYSVDTYHSIWDDPDWRWRDGERRPSVWHSYS